MKRTISIHKITFIMEKKELQRRIANLYSLESLLVLLNDFRKSKELEEHDIITLDKLIYYSNPNRTYGRYHTFSIPKKNGKKRIIYSPNVVLKGIQRNLNDIFKLLYTPSDNVTGFTEGRSVVTNAQKHTNKNYVFNIDLKDFFLNIPQARVWKRLQLPPFNFKMPVVNAIAGICSIKLFPSESTGKKEVSYVLPQGAPTSPILSNAICDTLDRRLNGLAKRFNATYTRYADDITFSSMHNIYNFDSEFIQELYRIIEEQGFYINYSKQRLQKAGSRQEVTGITVCKKTNVSKDFVRSLRQLLYVWNKYGLFEAEKCYFNHLMKKNQPIDGMLNMRSVIKGKLEFLKMVKGETDGVYQNLLVKYEQALLTKRIQFVNTKPFIEFEKKHGEIFFIENDAGNRYAYYKKTRRRLRLLSVSRNINISNFKKEALFVSKCIREDSSIFYLIHKERVRYPKEVK